LITHEGTLTYVGTGNVGSHAVVALARTGVLHRITLVDPDVCEGRNVRSQAFTVRDVGRRKVDALAALIRRVDPGLEVRTFAAPVEDVPLGALRADVIASGPDALEPRRTTSRAARRLGIPYVDAGVNAAESLARVTVFEPSPDAACTECGWSTEEHATLDRRYPCDGDVARSPTGASAHLGELAASQQVAECIKLLTGDTTHALLGHELLVGTAAHRHLVSRRTQAPSCPFDHRRWRIQRIEHRAGALGVRRALALLPGAVRSETRLRAYGDAFVCRLVCPRCNTSRETLRLARRIAARQRRCEGCGETLLATGIDLTDTLTLAHVRGRHQRASLASLGMRAGDVFTIEGPDTEAHFEIGG